MTVSIYTKKYCVYITVVCDVKLKLPTFYIGSSSVERVNNGYHGSVSSKQFKNLWKKEQKENPHNFSTHILSYHDTDKEARAAELALQKEHDVVKSPAFVNKSLASVNGYHGMDTSGENHPNYGGTLTDEHKKSIGLKSLGRKPMLNKHHTEQSKLAIALANTGKKQSESTVQKRVTKNTGQTRTKDSRLNISNGMKNLPTVECPHCNKVGGQIGMTRYHFNNCKLNPLNQHKIL